MVPKTHQFIEYPSFIPEAEKLQVEYWSEGEWKGGNYVFLGNPSGSGQSEDEVKALFQTAVQTTRIRVTPQREDSDGKIGLRVALLLGAGCGVGNGQSTAPPVPVFSV